MWAGPTREKKQLLVGSRHLLLSPPCLRVISTCSFFRLPAVGIYLFLFEIQDPLDAGPVTTLGSL